MSKADEEMRSVSGSVRASGRKPEDTSARLQEGSDKSSSNEARPAIEIHDGTRFVWPVGGGMPDVYPADY